MYVIKKMYDFMSYIFLHKFCYLRSKNICINKENNLIFKIVLETLINRRRKPNIILSMFFNDNLSFIVMIDKLKDTFFISSFSVELIESKTLPWYK